MKVDETDAGLAPAAALGPLTDDAVPEVKALIADVVLEFYGDLEFLPKDREGLLRHYERVGYLRDLDEHATVYGPGDGAFLILKEGETCADAVRLFRRNGFVACAPYKESIGEVFLCRGIGPTPA